MRKYKYFLKGIWQRLSLDKQTSKIEISCDFCLVTFPTNFDKDHNIKEETIESRRSRKDKRFFWQVRCFIHDAQIWRQTCACNRTVPILSDFCMKWSQKRCGRHGRRWWNISITHHGCFLCLEVPWLDWLVFSPYLSSPLKKVPT